MMGVTIKKTATHWQVDGTYVGQRLRRRFDKELPHAVVKQKVEALKREAIAKVGRDSVAVVSKTVGDACREYLRDRKELALSNIYKVRRFEEAMGKRRLSSLKGEDVEDWVRAQSWGDSTKRDVTGMCNAVLAFAREKGWCGEIRARKKGLRTAPIRDRFLTEAEEELLLLHTPEYLWPFVVMALMTGARGVELRRMTWEDVREIEGRMFVKLRHRKGATGDWQERHVPLNARAREAVQEQARLNGQKGVTLEKRRGFVFRNLWGEPWKANLRIAELLAEAGEKCGVEDVRLHDLRRTFASRLVARGADMRTVAELMGHGDVSMLKRYAHLSPGVADAAVNLL